MQRFAFANPNFGHLHINIVRASQRGLPLAAHDALAGARIAIAATGPTLTGKRLAELRLLAEAGWLVWGIKEALTLLTDAGVRCGGSVAMDPDPAQVGKYPRLDGVTYWLASSCDPALFDHLAGLDVRVFHSATGWNGSAVHPLTGQPVALGEQDIYRMAWGRGDCVMGGYSVANRSLALAKYLGAAQVRLYGTPFGWRPEAGYYADGVRGAAGNAGHDLRIVLPGARPWLTRPDLCASALHVAMALRIGACEVAGSSLAVDIAAQPNRVVHQFFPGQWPFSDEIVSYGQEAQAGRR